MFRFIQKKLRYKIMLFLFILMTLSSFLTMYTISKKIEQSNIEVTKKNLTMLNESIFQSLRNAMNSGDPTIIARSEEDARTIPGVKELVVAKSEKLIELYSNGAQPSNDPDIQKVFRTKQTELLEYTQDTHDLRMLRPMIATQECLMCHANQKEGDVIGVMDLTFSLEDSDSALYQIIFVVFLVSTALGWITLGIIYYLLQKATSPLETLEKGMKNLIESNDTTQTITIDTQDEIAEVTKHFNHYIQKVEEGRQNDQVLIVEAKEIIAQVKLGNYSKTIQKSTDNEILEQFKNNVNEMILQTRSHFHQINTILEQYSHYNYTNSIKLENIDPQGVFASLKKDIHSLKESILTMIEQNKKSGITLDDTSDLLLQNVEQLSENSNKAAVSLEETSAALEEITSNITGTTNHIIEMSKLASSVTQSAQKGEQLANETASAMDNINNEVTSIHEAITAIDQIAFQTNILSLNAAVEAATAGEAGRGFAVVAGEVRNLASRSAEAAKEIKNLVENATQKANGGKTTANEMISGYNTLQKDIVQTIQIIRNVELASKEQLLGINQINDAIALLDQQTQQNATIASKTKNIAIKIDTLSKSIVEDTTKKDQNVQ